MKETSINSEFEYADEDDKEISEDKEETIYVENKKMLEILSF